MKATTQERWMVGEPNAEGEVQVIPERAIGPDGKRWYADYVCWCSVEKAPLIAAAPELLAALEAALVQVIQDNDDRMVPDEFRGTEQQARAAIAKARGEKN